VSFIHSRLRKLELEERAGEGRCPECAGNAGIVVTYDASEPGVGTTAQRCPRCGRALTLIRVVYEGDEEGGGV
jgi:predicted RNA-binding Zn-ribbon protein involved in translation (DUF1610 family)